MAPSCFPGFLDRVELAERSVGTVLRRARHGRAYAGRVGTANGYYATDYRANRGGGRMPTLDMLERLANAVGRHLDISLTAA